MKERNSAIESLISIIVPVFKAEAYFKRCVDSIRNQTYRNIEIILIDDGSPDGCPKMCDEYAKEDTRIKVIHQKNQGVSVARNAGLNIAIGNYITFVDADDYIGPSYVERFVQEFASHPEADAVISGRTSVFNDKMLRYSIDENLSLSLAEFKKRYSKLDRVIGFGFVCSKFYKAALLKGLRFVSGMVMYEDALFNLSAYSLCHTIRLIKAADYFYNQTNENAATKCFNERLISCSKRYYATGKMFLYGKVKYQDDCFDHVVSQLGVSYTHFVCDQKIPWKKKKSLMKAMLEDDIYKMAAECSDPVTLRGRFLCSCCKHRHYQALRFYWWLRRAIRGSK